MYTFCGKHTKIYFYIAFFELMDKSDIKYRLRQKVLNEEIFTVNLRVTYISWYNMIYKTTFEFYVLQVNILGFLFSSESLYPTSFFCSFQKKGYGRFIFNVRQIIYILAYKNLFIPSTILGRVY